MDIPSYEKRYFYNGRSLPLKDWAKLKNTKTTVLYRRLHVKHWSFKKTMETPIDE